MAPKVVGVQSHRRGRGRGIGEGMGARCAAWAEGTADVRAAGPPHRRWRRELYASMVCSGVRDAQSRHACHFLWTQTFNAPGPAAGSTRARWPSLQGPGPGRVSEALARLPCAHLWVWARRPACALAGSRVRRLKNTLPLCATHTTARAAGRARRTATPRRRCALQRRDRPHTYCREGPTEPSGRGGIYLSKFFIMAL